MKIYSFLALIIFVALSLLPPINFIIHNPPLEYWLWIVILAGFFAVFTIFIKTDLALKVIAVTALLDSFFSAVPYLSFTSLILIVACCYFYILCTKVEDWSLIFKALQSVLILNVIFLFMQFIGHDPLLNFGVFHMEQFGIMGQHMQMSSFIVILTALLIMVSKWYILSPILLSIFCHSSWSFFCTGIGIFIYLFSISKKAAICTALAFAVLFAGWAIKEHKFDENMNSYYGRMAIWKRSVELSNQRPWFGWGAGTFKDVFQPISRINCTPYRNAHNFIIQFLFEFGYPLTIALVVALGWLLFNLYTKRLWLPLAGVSMMLCDSLVHFPDRCIQMVPLIVLMLAYCKFRLNNCGGKPYAE